MGNFIWGRVYGLGKIGRGKVYDSLQEYSPLEPKGGDKGKGMMMSLWLNECFGTIENKNMRGFRHRLAKAYTSIYDTAPIQSLILLSLKIRILEFAGVSEWVKYTSIV